MMLTGYSSMSSKNLESDSIPVLDGSLVRSRPCVFDLDEGEEIGVAPDAPLAVGTATESAERVAGMFAGFSAFDGGEGDLEEIPAEGEVAAYRDLLDVGAAGEMDHLDHCRKGRSKLFAAHRCAA